MLFSFQDREVSELRNSEERSSRERLNLSTKSSILPTMMPDYEKLCKEKLRLQQEEHRAG